MGRRGDGTLKFVIEEVVKELRPSGGGGMPRNSRGSSSGSAPKRARTSPASPAQSPRRFPRTISPRTKKQRREMCQKENGIIDLEPITDITMMSITSLIGGAVMASAISL